MNDDNWLEPKPNGDWNWADTLALITVIVLLIAVIVWMV